MKFIQWIINKFNKIQNYINSRLTPLKIKLLTRLQHWKIELHITSRNVCILLKSVQNWSDINIFSRKILHKAYYNVLVVFNNYYNIYNIDLLYILNLSCTWAIMRNRDTKIRGLNNIHFMCISVCEWFIKNISWQSRFDPMTTWFSRLKFYHYTKGHRPSSRLVDHMFEIVIYFDMVILSNIFSRLLF